MDSAGICYRRQYTLLAKSTAEGSDKYIYNMYMVYLPVAGCSVCSRYQSWPKRKGQRERAREMSLTKTKVHTTGSPISAATTLTKKLTSSQIRWPSSRVYQHGEKNPQTPHTHTHTHRNSWNRPWTNRSLKPLSDNWVPDDSWHRTRPGPCGGSVWLSVQYT